MKGKPDSEHSGLTDFFRAGLTESLSSDSVVLMPDRSHHALLEEIILQHNVVRHSVERLGELLANYQNTIPAPHAEGVKASRKSGIKSLDIWVGWLKENGPAFRQTIWDATGINLATSASPQIRKWMPHMEMWGDNDVPADMLFNIPGRSKRGMGRPPVVYFLWSQRYDVFPNFDVGPERPTVDTTGTSADLSGSASPEPEPDLGQQYLDTVTRPTELTAEDETVIDGLLGVVQPPEQRPPTWDDLVAGAKPWPEQSFDFTAEDLTADGIVSTVSHGESQSNEDGDADG